jgi:TrmH family RNA methyltransferase
VRRISSRQNIIVQEYRDAARGVDPAVLLLDGVHLVADALAAGIGVRRVTAAAETADEREIAALLSTAEQRGADVIIATAPVMSAISPVRSPSAIVGLGHRPDRERLMFQHRQPFVLIAADVQDPGNLGAIARVAEAAGASGLIAGGQSADPFSWKALRGSMGSALRLPISRRTLDVAIGEARRHGCRVVAAVPRGGRPLFDAPLTGPTAVLIGGEGQGLPEPVAAAADERITIPMQAPVESLNTAVTAAVIAYEVRRQRR